MLSIIKAVAGLELGDWRQLRGFFIHLKWRCDWSPKRSYPDRSVWFRRNLSSTVPSCRHNTPPHCIGEALTTAARRPCRSGARPRLWWALLHRAAAVRGARGCRCGSDFALGSGERAASATCTMLATAIAAFVGFMPHTGPPQSPVVIRIIAGIASRCKRRRRDTQSWTVVNAEHRSGSGGTPCGKAARLLATRDAGTGGARFFSPEEASFLALLSRPCDPPGSLPPRDERRGISRDLGLRPCPACRDNPQRYRYSRTLCRETLEARGAAGPALSRRLDTEKGLDVLLRSWERVQSHYPHRWLRIVGPAEAGHDQALRTLASALGLARVSIQAPVYGDAKQAAYRDAELFVLPSRNENFGLTVGQALAAGTPAISTRARPGMVSRQRAAAGGSNRE